MRSSSEDRTRDPWTGAALLVFLVSGLLLYPGAGRDDAYITFWPAWALAELGSLVNYNGDPVEQSSSLATVLVLAALRWVTGAPLAWLGWAFGIAAGLLTVAWCGALARRARGGGVARVAPLCLALAHPFVYWSFSGMETAFQALLMVGWVLAAERATRSGGTAGAVGRLLPWTLALCAVRPEAMFVLLCVAAAVTLRPPADGARLRAPVWLALGLSAGVLIAARVAWFDSWLPQPALAKAGRPLADSIGFALRHLATNPVSSALVAAAAAVGLAAALRGARTALALAGLMVTAQLGFVVFSGADWMEGARFLAPVLPLALVLILDAFPARWLPWALAVVLAAASARFALDKSRSLFAWQRPEVSHAEAEDHLVWRETKNLVHLRDAPTLLALGQILDALPAGERRFLLTGQGGMILFHLLSRRPGSLLVADRWGLLDRALISSPTARKVGPSTLGLKLEYPYLLEHWHAILAEAGLPEPDLVFDPDIGPPEAEALRRLGYEEVYAQKGDVAAGTKRFPGKQVVFLRRELAAALPRERLVSFRFSPTND